MRKPWDSKMKQLFNEVPHDLVAWLLCLWDIPTQTLKELGLVGLLPLLPLTREGKRREVVEEVLTELMPLGEEPMGELLALTYGLASLAFEHQEADQQWLLRRFAMIEDILRDTQAYKEMTKDSLQEGPRKGPPRGA